MKTQAYETIDFKNAAFVNEQYEVIANFTITDCIQKDLTIAGAFLQQMTFKHVIFQGCTFFSSKIAGCQFIACQFINCKFQFSSFADCQFFSCEFTGSQWDITHLQKNAFHFCSLDTLSAYYAGKDENHNQLESCFTKECQKTEEELSL